MRLVARSDREDRFEILLSEVELAWHTDLGFFVGQRLLPHGVAQYDVVASFLCKGCHLSHLFHACICTKSKSVDASVAEMKGRKSRLRSADQYVAKAMLVKNALRAAEGNGCGTSGFGKSSKA